MATTTNSISDLTRLRLCVDASQDLNDAGYDNGDEAQEDFRDAYSQCADHIAERSGVTIDLSYGSLSGPAAQGCDTADTDRGIWQAIHDCVYLDDEAGEWKYRIGAADDVADRLAKEVAEEIAALIVAEAKEAVKDAVADAMDGESDALTERVAELLADRLDD